MNIALFHTTLPAPDRKPGGVEVVVHRLGNALVHHGGHDVTVFSLTDAPSDAAYSHVRLFRHLPWLASWSLARWLLLPALLNFVSFRDFDVVHFHGDDWFYFRRTVPTLRTLHGSALEEARSAQSWKRRIAQRLIYPLEHLSARLATLTLGIGPRTAELYPLDELVNNGVDHSVFRPGAKAEEPTVLFVGTWEGRKRGRFLFEQFLDHVLHEVPNAKLMLVTDTVSTAARSHPNVEHVVFPSDQALAELYRQAWVFAYPSQYEGFGLPYVEAMASGTAVLCSPNDGASYVLDGGRYGLICEDDQFGPALKQLLTNANKRTRLVQKGRDRARSFSWNEIAVHHTELYTRALEQTRSAVEPEPVA